MRAAFRTLATLTPLAWGFSLLGRGKGILLWCLLVLVPLQDAFAVDYYWYKGSSSAQRYSSASAACSSGGGQIVGTSFPQSQTSASCCLYDMRGYCYTSFVVNRGGDSCPAGGVYNSQVGGCDLPKNCASTSGKKITAALTCSYSSSLKTYICDQDVSQDGCIYTGAGKKSCVADLASGTAVCTGDFYGSGQANDPGVDDSCTDESCGSSTDPQTGMQCVSNGDTTICHDPQKPGCGSVNGQSGCFQQDPGCGYFNGTYQCIDANKPQRNCGYFNGKRTCTDPNNPVNIIPSDSPDHPDNGGNADGNPNNDPKNPADTSGTASPQGGNAGATNESIDDLGEKLGEKIDKTNSLLDGIKGLLDDEYDAAAEWSDAEARASGNAAGDAMGQSVGSAVDDAVAERNAQVEEAIDEAPSTVDDFFGSSGERIPGLNSLGDFLPEAVGCSDYVIPINAMGVSIQVKLPVCFLSRFKTLIEWVLWCLTAIGLWNIFYSGLRLENAKASKGGY